MDLSKENIMLYYSCVTSKDSGEARVTVLSSGFSFFKTYDLTLNLGDLWVDALEIDLWAVPGYEDIVQTLSRIFTAYASWPVGHRSRTNVVM